MVIISWHTVVKCDCLSGWGRGFNWSSLFRDGIIACYEIIAENFIQSKNSDSEGQFL